MEANLHAKAFISYLKLFVVYIAEIGHRNTNKKGRVIFC